MKITDQELADLLRVKFGTFDLAAKAIGYAGYRPFRTALVKGFPEYRRQLAFAVLGIKVKKDIHEN